MAVSAGSGFPPLPGVHRLVADIELVHMGRGRRRRNRAGAPVPSRAQRPRGTFAAGGSYGSRRSCCQRMRRWSPHRPAMMTSMGSDAVVREAYFGRCGPGSTATGFAASYRTTCMHGCLSSSRRAASSRRFALTATASTTTPLAPSGATSSRKRVLRDPTVGELMTLQEVRALGVKRPAAGEGLRRRPVPRGVPGVHLAGLPRRLQSSPVRTFGAECSVCATASRCSRSSACAWSGWPGRYRTVVVSVTGTAVGGTPRGHHGPCRSSVHLVRYCAAYFVTDAFDRGRRTGRRSPSVCR